MSSNANQSIRKVKINEKKVEVHYVQHNYTEDEKVLNTVKKVSSEVTPHRDFVDAFQELKIHAILIMDLCQWKNKVDEKTLEKHIVTTLSVFESDDTLVVMILMNRYLANGKCYSVTSPRIELNSYDYDKLEQLATLVDTIIEEAGDYVQGKKHGEQQLKLEFAA